MTLLECFQDFWHQNISPAVPRGVGSMMRRFDRTLACDGQMGKQTPGHSICHASIASCGINVSLNVFCRV